MEGRVCQTTAAHSRSLSGDAVTESLEQLMIGLNKCIAVALFLPVFLSQSAYSQSCPSKITVSQRIESSPEGWTIRQDSTPLRLSAVAFYDGPPEQNVSIASQPGGHNKKGSETEIWRFRPNADAIWIGCSYASTNITLTRSLEQGVTECSVTYNPRVRIAGNREIASISCKSSPETSKGNRTPGGLSPAKGTRKE